MAKKLLDFQASISDVVQINPLFSTCRVRVLYTGKNRNMSIITKEAVEKAMPTLKNIPIVGEFSEAVEDYKGHGGAIDMDSYKYIHTTKPYGVVPESATYSWEQVRGVDGQIREYLSIEGCYLWTGRYEEAYSIIENGKGQSMEIEILDGQWNNEQEAYQIDNYVYSALCILGDDVEPAFEDANITSYSLADQKFKSEFSLMLNELDTSLTQEKEVNQKMIEELLQKYSTSMEVLTEKGLNFAEIEEAELEEKIAEALGVEVIVAEVTEEAEDKSEDAESEEEVKEADKEQVEDEFAVAVVEQDAVQVMKEIKDDEDKNLANVDAEIKDKAETLETEDEKKEKSEVEEVEVKVEDTQVADAGDTKETKETKKTKKSKDSKEFEALESRIVELEAQLVEFEALKEFKLQVEKTEHQEKVQKLFSDFQFTEEDVKDLNIHEFSLTEIEEKCYMIFGRKLKATKNFSKQERKEDSIRVSIGNQSTQPEDDGFGGLLFAVKEKQ